MRESAQSPLNLLYWRRIGLIDFAEYAPYFNFLLVDEPVLGGWQSGLLWADWRRKPAFDAYRTAIAEVRGGTVDCAAALRG